MKTLSKMAVMVLIVLFAAQPVLAAASSAQLIPTGKVSVLSGGKEVKQFKAEMPLPQGVMMLCNGSCLVQLPNLQMVAQDRAVFGLSEGREIWDLTVKEGRVDFAIRPDSKLVAFRVPGDLLRIEKVIVPAGTAGMVRGYISVTKEGTELAVQEGTLQVAGSQGSQLVQPGLPIVLAQAKVPSPEESQQSDKDKDAAAGAGAAGAGAAGAGAGATGLAGLAGISTTTMVVGGLGVIGAVAGGVAAASAAGGGGGAAVNQVSPY